MRYANIMIMRFATLICRHDHSLFISFPFSFSFLFFSPLFLLRARFALIRAHLLESKFSDEQCFLYLDLSGIHSSQYLHSDDDDHESYDIVRSEMLTAEVTGALSGGGDSGLLLHSVLIS